MSSLKDHCVHLLTELYYCVKFMDPKGPGFLILYRRYETFSKCVRITQKTHADFEIK